MDPLETGKRGTGTPLWSHLWHRHRRCRRGMGCPIPSRSGIKDRLRPLSLLDGVPLRPPSQEYNILIFQLFSSTY